MTMPTWLNEFGVISTFLTAVAAATIALQSYRLAREQANTAREQARIADQQARTAQQRLRLDLFATRYSIFNTAMNAMVAALNGNRSAASDEIVARLRRKVRRARFLFDEETFDYLRAIETKVLLVSVGNDTINKSGFMETAAGQSYMNEFHLDQRWLLDQLRELPVRVERFIKVEEDMSFSTKAAAETAEQIAAVIKRSQ